MVTLGTIAKNRSGPPIRLEKKKRHLVVLGLGGLGLNAAFRYPQKQVRELQNDTNSFHL